MILHVTEIEARPAKSLLPHNPTWKPRLEYFLTGKFISDGYFIGKSHNMVGKKTIIPIRADKSFGIEYDLAIGTLISIEVNRWPNTNTYEVTMQIAVSELL